MLLKAYYGRELTPFEHPHAMDQSSINALIGSAGVYSKAMLVKKMDFSF